MCREGGPRLDRFPAETLAGGADGPEAGNGTYCEIFSGLGEWFDMGTTPGQEDKYYDLVKMTNRGREQIRTADSGTTLLDPCAIPDPPFLLSIRGLTAKRYDTVELFAGGLSMGPCYSFAWDQLVGWLWADDPQPPYVQVVDGPTAIGEFCTGGSIALGLTKTLMAGFALAEPPFRGKGAVFLVEPVDAPGPACASSGVYSRVTVIPLDASGGPLPAGQDVSIVADPPFIVGGGVEPFTDPATGVTEYRLEVGSDRCTQGAAREVAIRVGGTILHEKAQVSFSCPEVAEDGASFVATPSRVPADGDAAALVRVEARDRCGNPAFGREVALAVAGDVPAVLSAASTMTADAPGDPLDGVALVRVSSRQPGQVGLVATIGGRAFSSPPDLVTFTSAADPDAGPAPDGHADGGAASENGCSCHVPSRSGERGRGPALLLFLLGTLIARARPRRG